MRFRKIFLNLLILVLPFLIILSVKAQILDEKSKAEAAKIREKVKSLTTESDRVKYLIAYIEDKNSLIPEYAVSLLGVLKSKEALSFLINLLGSSDSHYYRAKEFVPQALVNIKDKSSIEPLIEALGDKNLIVAKRSAIALVMLTSYNPGIRFDTFEQNQEEAIRLWRNWWQKNKEVVEINEKQKTQKEESSKTLQENNQKKSN
jgi:DNA-binding phage protein